MYVWSTRLLYVSPLQGLSFSIRTNERSSTPWTAAAMSVMTAAPWSRDVSQLIRRLTSAKRPHPS